MRTGYSLIVAVDPHQGHNQISKEISWVIAETERICLNEKAKNSAVRIIIDTSLVKIVSPFVRNEIRPAKGGLAVAWILPIPYLL